MNCTTTTACQQHAHLNSTSSAFFFTRPRTRRLVINQAHRPLCAFLLLAGDIELNPGPSTDATTSTRPFTICSHNIRSMTHIDHQTALFDLTDTHHFDLIALSETLITSDTTTAHLLDSTPSGYDLWSLPRAGIHCGGGVAFLLKRPYRQLSFNSFQFKTFEAIATTLQLPSAKLTVYNIYRPPPSNKHKSKFSEFLQEFQDLLSTAMATAHEFIITGDFNIHVDDPKDNNAKNFLSILAATNLHQLVNFPTHNKGHTLDLVIVSANSSLQPTIDHTEVTSSDHFPIFTSLHIAPPPPQSPVFTSFRRIASIDTYAFIEDIATSQLITDPPTSLPELVNAFNSTLHAILDKHAPLITKLVPSHSSNRWFTPALSILKTARRKFEKTWKHTHSVTDLDTLRFATKLYHKAIIKAKKLYHSELVQSSTANPRRLWKTVNNLLHRNTQSTLPASDSPPSLPQLFATFFTDKIAKIHAHLVSKPNSSPHSREPPTSPDQLHLFHPATIEEVCKLLHQSPDKQCDLDPIPTSLLKKCSAVLLPTITNIINLSLSTATVPDNFKQSIVTPLLKKPSLDKESFSNYRPISNLSLLSKLTERIVKQRLDSHLSTNSLFNKYQSAYTKYHSTETTLLALHDHLIQAISQQKLTGLCLLDLSAAFDTIDHSILLHRLSV